MTSKEEQTDKIVPDVPLGEVLLGRWRIEAHLADRPTGTLYRAVDVAQGDSVLVKVLSSSFSEDAAFVARFDQETRAITELDHPHVVRRLGSGRWQKAPFLISPLLQGETLAERFRRDPAAVGSTTLLQWARGLCEGLREIHAHRLVHRDLKPSNLFIDTTGELRILDLGLGRDRTDSLFTSAGKVVGSPGYLAPEQVMALALDARTDLYSAGAVLFHLMVGRPPFEAPTLQGLLQAILMTPPPAPASLAPDLPAAGSAVVLRALSKSPGGRFPSAQDLLEALQEAFGLAPQTDEAVPAPGPASPQAPAPDVHQLGKYRLVRKLAAGGMGEVFLGTAPRADGGEDTFAIKRILPDLAEEPKFVERFLREARLCARLQHPHIARVEDYGEIGGVYFIAMEYVDGPNLRSLTNFYAKQAPIPLALCAKAISMACDGLAHAHSVLDPDSGQPSGVVHRDISPENILISRAGEIKIVDFGLAKSLDSKTKSTSLRGKYAYLAPEQIASKRPDQRVDLFAIGIVLYELLTGLKPFIADTDLGMLRAIANDPYVPAGTRRPEVPEELERIIARALEKDPAQRYPSAAEMRADLDGYLARSFGGVESAALAQLVEGYNAPPQTSAMAPPSLAEEPFIPTQAPVVSPTPVVGEPTRAGRPANVVTGPSAEPPAPSGQEAVTTSKIEGRPPPRRSKPGVAALSPAPPESPPAPRAARPPVQAPGVAQPSIFLPTRKVDDLPNRTRRETAQGLMLALLLLLAAGAGLTYAFTDSGTGKDDSSQTSGRKGARDPRANALSEGSADENGGEGSGSSRGLGGGSGLAPARRRDPGLLRDDRPIVRENHALDRTMPRREADLTQRGPSR